MDGLALNELVGEGNCPPRLRNLAMMGVCIATPELKNSPDLVCLIEFWENYERMTK